MTPPPLALITGGGTGIGRAQAIALARSGATVIVAGRRKEPLEAVRSELGTEHCHVLAEADISKPETWQTIVAKIEELGGELHMICNTAGHHGVFGSSGFYENLTPEYIINFNTSYISSLQLSYHYLAPLLKQGAELRGKPSVVINMSSMAAVAPKSVAELLSLYAPAKTAMDMITRCAYNMYKDKNILSYSLQPVVYESPMANNCSRDLGMDVSTYYSSFNPLPVLGDPKDIGAITVTWFQNTASPSMVSGVAYMMAPLTEDIMGESCCDDDDDDDGPTTSILFRVDDHRATQDSNDPLIYRRVWSELREAYTVQGKRMPEEQFKCFRDAMRETLKKMHNKPIEI